MQTRDDTWIALDSRYKSFMDCLGQLTEEELTTTSIMGKWTAKDVMAHVWSWLDEAVKTVKAWQDERPWQQDVAYDDAWNASQVADRSLLPLITVVDSLTGAHRSLIHQLDLASDEALMAIADTPWGTKMTLLDFFDSMGKHYEEHAAILSAFQEQCLGCD